MYRHTQVARVVVISLGIGIMLVAYLGVLFSDWVGLLVAAILVLFVALFGSLTVTVHGSFVEIRFGVGLIRRRFSLEEIESCDAVRNPWWYGWGIKKIPRGWLFNVSGLDAVELTMRNGAAHRIGTDEPQKLHRAIQMRLGGMGGE